jgi:hypothetical protein
VVLWELVTLKEPWREETEGRPALYYIMNSIIDGKRLEFAEPEGVQPPLLELPRCVAQQPGGGRWGSREPVAVPGRAEEEAGALAACGCDRAGETPP